MSLSATLVILALAACSNRAPQAADAEDEAKPDIFLITVDTLRADRLGAYGHPVPTSPFIDSLAAEGVRFDRAYSTSSWTVPSVVSMLTSTYPLRHGMGERSAPGDGSWHVIPSDLPSLPEALKEAGYRTYGFAANFGLPSERGFARGFLRYRCIGAVDTGAIDRELERWLPDLEAEGPWFFWLHLFDPHVPYTAREPWLSELHPSSGEAGDGAEISAARIGDFANHPEVIEPALEFYDSEIRNLDQYLSELYARVPRAREALVLFTADHGEEFLDHGDVMHGRQLYDETTRVPFIVRFPDRRHAGRAIDRPASLVDVLPTLLSVAGIDPPTGIAGLDLTQALSEPAGPSRLVFAELENEGRHRAVSDGRWKYIASDSGAPPRLFDLAQDPGEIRNLVSERPEIAARFRRRLAEFAAGHANEGTRLDETAMTEEQAEALRTLGYVN